MEKEQQMKRKAKNNEIERVILATVLGFIIILFITAYFNYFEISWFVSLVLATCLAIIIFRVPEAGIHLIILAVMVLERWFSLKQLTIFGTAIKIYPLDILLVITGAAVLLNSQFKLPILNKKVVYPLVIFFSAIVLWSIFSLFQGGDQNLIASVIKNTIFYSLTFFIILIHCQSKEKWMRIFATILLGGLLLIGFIFYGILAGEGLWSAYTPLSTSGSRLLAATHAFFIIFPLYLLISLYSFKQKFLGKWDFLALLIWMVGLIFSLFRNLWIGFGLGLVLTLLFLKRKQLEEFMKLFGKILLLAIIFSVIIIWFLYLVTADTRLLDDFTSAVTDRAASLNPFAIRDESARFRLAAWEESGKQFLLNPLLGIGFGQELEFELSGNEYKIQVRELHNDYVAFALQMGIIGFAAFIYFIVAMIKKSVKTVIRASLELKPYLIATFAFFSTFLILAAMGTYWETNFYLVFFWLSLGLLIAAGGFKELQENEFHQIAKTDDRLISLSSNKKR